MTRPLRVGRSLFGLAIAMAVALPLACSSGFLDGLSGGSRLRADSGSPPPLETGVPSADGSELPTGCDAAASFCADFDHGALGATWTDASLTPNGSIALVEGGVSLPFAFQASFVTGTPNTTAYLAKDVGGSDTIRCEFDLMIPSAPAQGEVDYFSFNTFAPEVYTLYKLYFTRYDGTWSLGEYGVPVDGGPKLDRSHAILTVPPTGRWTHVALLSDHKARTLSITFDGKPPETMGGNEQFTLKTRQIQAGIAFATGNADTSSALYDNLSCDWTL